MSNENKGSFSSLIALSITCLIGLLLGVSQSTPDNHGFNAGNKTGAISGDSGRDDSDVIKNIITEIGGYSTATEGTGETKSGAGTPKADSREVNSETNGLNQSITYYRKRNVGQDQNEIIKYASEISGNNLDFIATLEAENGLWEVNRISGKNKNGSHDYGLCQLNDFYHKSFISSPEFKDYKKQIKYCYGVYIARPTAFYGYYKKNKMKSKFYLTLKR